jgi:ribosomal protein S27AE
MNDNSWHDVLKRNVELLNSLLFSTLRRICLAARRGRVLAACPPCLVCGIVVSDHEPVRWRCGHSFCESCVSRMASEYLVPACSDPYHEVGRKVRNSTFFCPNCHAVSVLHRSRRRFDPAVTTFPPIVVLTVADLCYVLDVNLSDHFANHTKVATYYANERYVHFTGRYSSSNLLPLDYRGACSNEHDCAVEVSRDFRLPNSSWHWATDWHVDHTIGDADGWQYAFNWPDTGIVPGQVWSNTKTFTSYVRRRRFRRVMIHLGPDVLDQWENRTD